MAELLKVDNLETCFFSKTGHTRVIRGISYDINRKETLGVVGESGCGKSVTSLSVLRLLAQNGRVSSGKITFDGIDLLSLPKQAMRKMRGKRIAMIFQEPMTALNPVLKVGSQIVEQLCAHKIGQDKAERWDRAVELLSTVGIPSPGNRVKQYPHQLSGGMRQRVMIAMALSCNPDLLIADEPTTALDVTIQAQILELLRELQDKFGMAIQFITHDMGVISEISDRIIVMYAGIIVESGPAEEIFANPRHPYTVGLLNSIPRIGGTQNRLNTIEGTVPNLANLPKGCPFQNRCSRVKDICTNTEVKLELIAGKQSVACFNPVPA